MKLEYFIEKLEKEKLEREELKKINEQKILDDFNRQREFLLKERMMYEVIYNRSSSSGKKYKRHEITGIDYLIDENGDYIIDENGDYIVFIT
jgi:hypothetical protein